MSPYNAFSYYLMPLIFLHSNVFVLREFLWSFEICRFLTLFLSPCSLVSIYTGQNFFQAEKKYSLLWYYFQAMLFGFLSTKFDESFVNSCRFSCVWGSYIFPFQLIILIKVPISIEKMRKTIILMNSLNSFLLEACRKLNDCRSIFLWKSKALNASKTLFS